MKHLSRSRSTHGRSAPWRAFGAVLIALGLVLLSPAAIAGAQTGDTPDVPGDVTPEVPDQETPDDETPDETPDEETPDGEAPEEETPDETPDEETPAPEVPEENDAQVVWEGENVRVVHTPDGAEGPCTPIPADSLINYIGSDEEVFTMRVIVKQALCDPIAAKAVIYAMPATGTEPWPQTLDEVLEFTIQGSGEYEVTFTKTCERVQFDVLTGETPEVIQPLGEWHGPLLFPFDVNTSLQHWGCEEVAAATTVPPVTEEVAPAVLALTGSSSGPAAAAGVVALLAGAVLLLAVRRRTV